MQLRVSLQGKGFDALVNLARDTPKKLAKQISIAENRTAKAHRKEISRNVRKHLAVTNKGVLEVVKVAKQSRVGSLSSVVKLSKTARLSLKRFKARQTKKGVTYKIDKAGRRKLVPGGFVVASRGGHAFKRKTKARLPITKLHGPSIAGVFAKHQLIILSEIQVRDRMEKEMQRRVRAMIVSTIRKTGRSSGLSTEQINDRIQQRFA